MDIISIVNGLLGLVGKARTLAEPLLKCRKRRADEQAKAAAALLHDIRGLIDKYAETIDIIADMLTDRLLLFDSGMTYMTKFLKNISACLKANRRLLEIASDMRILARGLSQRLHAKEDDTLHLLETQCYQIIYIEDDIALCLAPQTLREQLPLNPDPRCLNRIPNSTFDKIEIDSFSCSRHEEFLARLHAQVLRLHGAKEEIAMLLQGATESSRRSQWEDEKKLKNPDARDDK